MSRKFDNDFEMRTIIDNQDLKRYLLKKEVGH